MTETQDDKEFAVVDEHWKENKGYGILEVRPVNEADNIPEALGIPKDRVLELREISQKNWRDCDVVTNAIAEISKHCRNVNELAMICMEIGLNVASEEED